MGESLVSALWVAIVLGATVVCLDTVDPYRDNPLTAFDVSGHLGKSVTLRCRFLTGAHSRGWLVIKWHKMETAELPLVSLSARLKVPEWNPEIPDLLRSRIQPSITIQSGHVEFNMVLSNLTCTDEGEYRCRAITSHGELTSSAELGIYGRPQTPSITYQLIPPSRPTRIEASCRADVGFPAKMLVWYFRRPESSYFMVVDRQPDVVIENDGCHTVSTRTVNVMVNSATTGTHFRCGYPGYIEKDGMYDQLVVGVFSGGNKDERTDGKMAAMCESEPCGGVDTSPGNKDERADFKMAAMCESQPCGDGDTSPGDRIHPKSNRASRASTSIYVMLGATAFTFTRASILL